jgi:hypothetical protein
LQRKALAGELCRRPIDLTLGVLIWNQGFGTELVSLLVEFATGTLGAREVHATTLDDNPASARVLEKLGFTVREVGASEVDSRGCERRVTRWVLQWAAEPQARPPARRWPLSLNVRLNPWPQKIWRKRDRMHHQLQG